MSEKILSSMVENMILPDRVQQVKPFLAMEILEKAQALEAEGKSIIHLEVGEPGGETPDIVKEAATRAIQQNDTAYTHSLGKPELREEICKAGVSIAKNISYENAGTVEFILDQDTQKFYFLEMNTRVQVEHPVTEMITGIDIVQEQIKIAARYPLSISQSDVQFSGHAIECRINAESPTEGFQPKPGRIIDWLPPQDKGVRVDTHCYGGYSIPPYYDSLMAKIITTGSNRLAAVNKMQSSLHKFIVSGVDTTIPFLQFLINEKDYFEGRINTRWVEKALPKF